MDGDSVHARDRPLAEPAQRRLRAEVREIAEVAAFLASRDARCIDGQAPRATGGTV